MLGGPVFLSRRRFCYLLSRQETKPLQKALAALAAIMGGGRYGFGRVRPTSAALARRRAWAPATGTWPFSDSPWAADLFGIKGFEPALTLAADTPRRAVRPKTAAEKEFCALGPVAEAFITGAAASGCTRLAAELAELNTLRAAHGEQAFLAALDRAVAFCRWRAADVRSILAAGAVAPQPTAAGDPLGVDLPDVPVCPLADYAIGSLS